MYKKVIRMLTNTLPLDVHLIVNVISYHGLPDRGIRPFLIQTASNGIGSTTTASPTRDDFRLFGNQLAPSALEALRNGATDGDRGSTGGASDRGYASMTKEEALQIARTLASPELAGEHKGDLGARPDCCRTLAKTFQKCF
jgi:hypothetical protein